MERKVRMEGSIAYSTRLHIEVQVRGRTKKPGEKSKLQKLILYQCEKRLTQETERCRRGGSETARIVKRTVCFSKREKRRRRLRLSRNGMRQEGSALLSLRSLSM